MNATQRQMGLGKWIQVFIQCGVFLAGWQVLSLKADTVQFAPPITVLTNYSINALIAADFNRDGISDLAISDYSTKISLLLNPGINMVKVSPITNNDQNPHLMAVGDFNNDGNTDLFSSDPYVARIFLGDGQGGLNFQTNSPTTYSANSIAVADFNHDGKADFAMSKSSMIDIRFGRADGSFDAATNYSLLNFSSNVRAGDVNGDGWLDLVVSLDSTSAFNSNSFCVLQNIGGGRYGAPMYFASTHKASYRAPVLNDFNRDGRLDIALINSTRNQIMIWRNDGNGSFFVANTYTLNFTPSNILHEDFNGDGIIDLMVLGGSTARCFSGNGDGTFNVSGPILVPSGLGTLSFGSDNNVAVGDFNGDGRPDIAWISGDRRSVVLMLNETQATLSFDRMEGYNQITWSATFGAGFKLEYSTNLSASTSWQPFPYPPVTFGGQKGVADWSDGRMKFYRLVKP